MASKVGGSQLQDTFEESKQDEISSRPSEEKSGEANTVKVDNTNSNQSDSPVIDHECNQDQVNSNNSEVKTDFDSLESDTSTEQTGSDIANGNNLTPDTKLLKKSSGETSSQQTTSNNSEIVVEDIPENIKYEEHSMTNDNYFEANPKHDDDSNNQFDKGHPHISHTLDENREFKQDSDNVNNKVNEGQESNTDIACNEKADCTKENISNIHPDSKGDTHGSYLKDENPDFSEDIDQMKNIFNVDQEPNIEQACSPLKVQDRNIRSDEGQDAKKDLLESANSGTEQADSPEEIPNTCSKNKPDGIDENQVLNAMTDELCNSKQNSDQVSESNNDQETDTDLKDSDITRKEQAGSPVEVQNSNSKVDGKCDTGVSNLVEENGELNQGSDQENKSAEDQESSTYFVGSDNTGTEQADSSKGMPNSKNKPDVIDESQVSNPMTDEQVNRNNYDQETEMDIQESDIARSEKAGSPVEIQNSNNKLDGKCNTKVLNPADKYCEFNQKSDQEIRSSECQGAKKELLESDNTGTEKADSPEEMPNSKNKPNGIDKTQVSNSMTDELCDLNQNSNQVSVSNNDQETETDLKDSDITRKEQAGSPVEVQNSNSKFDGKCETEVPNLADENYEFNQESDQEIRSSECRGANKELLESDNAGTEKANSPKEMPYSKNKPDGIDEIQVSNLLLNESCDLSQNGEQVSGDTKDQETTMDLNCSYIASREQAGSPVEVQNSNTKFAGKCDTEVSNLEDNDEFNHGSDQESRSNEVQGAMKDLLESDSTGTEKADSPEELPNSQKKPHGIDEIQASNPMIDELWDLNQNSDRVSGSDKDQETEMELKVSDIASREQAGSPVKVQNSNNEFDGKCDTKVSNPAVENCEFKQKSDQKTRSNEGQGANTDFVGSDNTRTQQEDGPEEMLNSKNKPDGIDETQVSNPVTDELCDQNDDQVSGSNKDQETKTDLKDSDISNREQAVGPVEVQNSNNKLDDKCDYQIYNLMDEMSAFKQGSDQELRNNEDQESKADFLGSDNTDTEQAGSSTEISNTEYHPHGKDDIHASNQVTENRESNQEVNNKGQNCRTDVLESETAATEQVSNLVPNKNLSGFKDDDTQNSYQVNKTDKHQESKTNLQDSNIKDYIDNRVSERHQGTEIQQPVGVKEKLIPSEGFKSKIYSPDCERFRNGYPEDKVDNEKLQNNWLFYSNKMEFLPGGEYIDIMHKDWKENYNKLEDNHCYIQWLFPIREQGVNYHSQILQRHEAKKIKENKKACKRVINSLELMLDFYGISVKKINRPTGDNYELCKSPNWERRCRHLNWSFHNWQRITRILKCMCELGFMDVQFPLICFFFNEIFITKDLCRAEKSFMQFWLQTLKDDNLRLHIEERAEKSKRDTSLKFSDEFLILPKSFTDAKESLQEMNQEQSKGSASVNQETDADGESSVHEENIGPQLPYPRVNQETDADGESSGHEEDNSGGNANEESSTDKDIESIDSRDNQKESGLNRTTDDISTSQSSLRQNQDGTFNSLVRRPVVMLCCFFSKLILACVFFPINAHVYVCEKCQVKRWKLMCPVYVVRALTRWVWSYWAGGRDDGRRIDRKSTEHVL